MQVAGATGGGDAVLQLLLGVAGPFRADQGLGRHEIAGSVVRMMLQQDSELGQGAIEIALPGIFHGETVTGKRILGILREHFVEGGNAVHRRRRLSNEITTNREARSHWPEAREVNTIGIPRNCERRKFRARKRRHWLVLISCRLQDWRMATGHIRRDFRWVVAGRGSARRRAMRANPRARMLSRHSAI